MARGRVQTPRMSPVLKIFLTDFRLEGGGWVRGAFNPPKSSAASGFELPFRFFRTPRQVRLLPGTVFQGAEGRNYLLLDNGVEEKYGVDFRSYKVVELNHTFDVRRNTTVTDAVTGRTAKTSQTVVKSDLNVYMQPLRPASDTFRVEMPRYRVYTNYALEVGDLLGDNLVVRRVENQLGVYMAEVE